MSGHNKWSQIKHQKGITDARRGQLFTKLAREIIISAKGGGADPAGNVRLRLAIQRAKDANMPNDNIDRAIKKGAGSGEGTTDLSELTYEGYTPGGAAIYVQAATDNRNRLASEVRRVFTHNGGRMGEAGTVAWLFQNRGVISATAPAGKVDDIALAAIDAGADDVKEDRQELEVYTAADKLEIVRKALEAAGAKVASAEMQMVPSTTMQLDHSNAKAALRMMDQLDQLDDVQKVFSNADFPDAVLAEVAGSVH